MSNSPFPSYWQDDNNKDPLSIVDTRFPTNDRESRICFKMGHTNSVNTPFGSNVDTDFYYEAFRTRDNTWDRMVAYDVRSFQVFTIQKSNNVWQNWRAIVQRSSVTNCVISQALPFEWCNIEYLSGVYNIFGRIFTSTAVTIHDGDIIGKINPSIYANPHWSFPVMTYNFQNATNYLLWFQDNGDILIYGVGTQTITFDCYFNTTYIR
jgi:hypothetical protein